MKNKKNELTARKNDLTMPEKTFDDITRELIFEWKQLHDYQLHMDDLGVVEFYRKSEIDRIFKKFTEQVSKL